MRIEADTSSSGGDEETQDRKHNQNHNHNRGVPRVYHIAGCTGKYTDVVSASIQSVKRVLLSPQSKRKGPRGGVSEPFPTKLYEMLLGLEEEQMHHIAAWRDHGRCFEITDTSVFADDVMPRYFKQSKLTSFQRQLNLYGFQRVASGIDKGCFYHPLFLRGRPDICRIILRTRVKGNYGTVTIESQSDTQLECNSFYDLPPCPPTVPVPAVEGNTMTSSSTTAIARTATTFPPLVGQGHQVVVVNNTSKEDGEEQQQQQLQHHHRSITWPSSPQPETQQYFHYTNSTTTSCVPMIPLSPNDHHRHLPSSSLFSSSSAAAAVPYTLPVSSSSSILPYPDVVIDAASFRYGGVVPSSKRYTVPEPVVQQQQQQNEQLQLQMPQQRTPHYDYVTPTCAAAVEPCQSSSSSSSYNNSSSNNHRVVEYYYSNNHYNNTTTSNYHAVSPTHELLSNQHNNKNDDDDDYINSTNGWLPVLPSDVSLPEDEIIDNVESDDFLPTWGRAFQCLDDDGIQAYERCIERRYRPCQQP